jgi:hypothetical protein
MSTEVFNFTVHRPYHGEGGSHRTAVTEAEGGRLVRKPILPSDGIFRVRTAQLRFPPNTYSTFVDFFNARRGYWREVRAEALGTGDASTVVFALDSMYIDATTLVVYVDDVEEESGWTLVGNNTAPRITFDTAPAEGEVITADYDRYISVTFSMDDIDPKVLSLGSSDANSILMVPFGVAQDRAGSHLV